MHMTIILNVIFNTDCMKTIRAKRILIMTNSSQVFVKIRAAKYGLFSTQKMKINNCVNKQFFSRSPMEKKALKNSPLTLICFVCVASGDASCIQFFSRSDSQLPLPRAPLCTLFYPLLCLTVYIHPTYLCLSISLVLILNIMSLTI